MADDEYIPPPSDADAPDAEAVSETANLGLVSSGVAYDELAEQSAVGGMLLDPAVIDDVMEELSPSDFWLPKHEVIARAIVTLHARNRPTDVIAVADELARTGEIRNAGHAEYLHHLTSVPPTAANAGFYAAIVHRKAVLRRLAAAGKRIAAMGEASEGDVDEQIENARKELDAVPSGRRTTIRSVGDTIPEVIDSLSEKPTYMHSPWEALDRLIGGFSRGQLVIVGGRPSDGKSVVLVQIATRLAHEGLVAFSSLEMSEEEITTRLIAQYGPVHMRSLRDRTLKADDWVRIAEARQRIQGAPLFVDATGAATLAQIRAHARAVARRGELSCIAVDYLQLVATEGSTQRSRQQELGTVSRGLKQLAKDMNVVVVAAAQLKRGNPRVKSLPTMEDLRESGDLEQDADLVILLHRDREKKAYELQMIVAKYRQGATGRFTLHFQGEFARARDKTFTPTALIDEQEVG